MGQREESDGLGRVTVPADRYWGAQTQRSLQFFAIGDERMPIAVVRALAIVKKAAAIANSRMGRLPQRKADAIIAACDEVVAGDLDDHFPLSLWQTGSGTQTNMNVNEVLANRAIELLGGELGSREPVHPNDDVNMSQSTNDAFPTAMHLAGYEAVVGGTIPSMRRLSDSLTAKATEWDSIVKIGRTHLMDATPLTVGQEWSGYASALGDAVDALEHATDGLLDVALGGTAVGTGLNAPIGFTEQAVAVLAELTGSPFRPAPNPFAAQSTLDRMVRAHAALKGAAVSLFKIANDLRWSGSGPRTGLGELRFPANEPGSSIMPGKVNPTQAEAMLMVCIQVMGSDVSVQMAGSEGNFELNAFRPIVIGLFLQSAVLLADACDHLRRFMIEDTQLDLDRIRSNVEHSVMMVTALSPHIGYDRATSISHFAIEHGLTLREAAIANGVDTDLFDRVVVPIDMTRPHD